MQGERMPTLVSQEIRLSEGSEPGQHHTFSPEAMEQLRRGLATCRATRGLTPEARDAISMLTNAARRDGWTPEQLLVAVKDACYTSTEISHLTTTSERDAFLAKIVTVCIQEFFRDGHPERNQ
jgi:hypothetical protein